MARPACRRSTRSRGFTLIELMVVIGVILVLLSVLMPALSTVWRQAERNRMRSDLNTIATALDAYAADFRNEYPRSGFRSDGSHSNHRVLGVALIAPGPASGPGQDGADGPGFRTAPQGRIYGPYLPSDRFKVQGDLVSRGNRQVLEAEILDRYGQAIEYLPKWRDVGVLSGPLVGRSNTQGTMIDNRDAFAATKGSLQVGISNSTAYLQRLIGDSNMNNKIDAGESMRFNGNFILLSRGPDKEFADAVSTDPANTDDLANFDLK